MVSQDADLTTSPLICDR